MQNIRDTELLLKFGANLKRLRNEKNLTQEDLAFKTGLTLSQIARIETGRVNTTVCTIYVIAQGLEVLPEELFKFNV